MGDQIIKEMLPEEHIHEVDLHEGIELYIHLSICIPF